MSSPREPAPGTGQGAPALVAQGICRSFGGREVLRALNLTIGRGEFVAILGRSGCGKSTLLRILADLDPEAVGKVEVPARVAVAFQDARLLPWKRVAANVGLGVRDPDVEARVARALADVGMTDRHRAWPSTLSGGETARVALARALVREPELLLRDEPFGSLDALTRLRMQELLATLCARYRPTVLMVTHDVDEALLLADRVVVMVDGVLEHEVTLGAAASRTRSGDRFGVLREQLLGMLGVHGH